MSSAALSARPHAPTRPSAKAAAGLHRIPISGPRPAWLQVPTGWTAESRAPLAVMLHGAGGDAAQGLALLEPGAARAGALVLATASQSYTWDGVLGTAVDGRGPDVAQLDEALAWVFEHYRIDEQRLTIGGFSDGASYALGLGLANGGLFRKILALSPGFVPPLSLAGEPSVFVSHGRADEVLPIAHCSRRIVPALQGAGYAVEYLEFDGGHEVPPAIAAAALAHLLR